MKLKTYLICISYNDFNKAKFIINNFLNTDNKNYAELILVENGNKENYKQYRTEYRHERNIELLFFETPNKSTCLNRAINGIKEKDALIICIDNDVNFSNYFVKKYQDIAFKKGNRYYFGGGLIVPLEYTELINTNYKCLYQASQSTRNDVDFSKMDSLMFFGANFCFFKSQWIYVKGFDERFAPGSKYGLSGQESIFQKKLKYVGFIPNYVLSNAVTHYPEKESYSLKRIKERTRNNGYTHGFNRLINSQKFLKWDYLANISAMIKVMAIFLIKNNKYKFTYKKEYFLGYFKSFFLFVRFENKKSIYHDLKQIN